MPRSPRPPAELPCEIPSFLLHSSYNPRSAYSPHVFASWRHAWLLRRIAAGDACCRSFVAVLRRHTRLLSTERSSVAVPGIPCTVQSATSPSWPIRHSRSWPSQSIPLAARSNPWPPSQTRYLILDKQESSSPSPPNSVRRRSQSANPRLTLGKVSSEWRWNVRRGRLPRHLGPACNAKSTQICTIGPLGIERSAAIGFRMSRLTVGGTLSFGARQPAREA